VAGFSGLRLRVERDSIHHSACCRNVVPGPGIWWNLCLEQTRVLYRQDIGQRDLRSYTLHLLEQGHFRVNFLGDFLHPLVVFLDALAAIRPILSTLSRFLDIIAPSDTMKRECDCFLED
jgi:hypothetical protein